MTTAQLTTWVNETRTAAANPEHEWDRRALDWPLTKKSVVVEVGGYKGRWALQIAERYSPKLYVFEPQPWAYEVCCEVLGDRAIVVNDGLGVRDDMRVMGEWGTDGCSFLKSGAQGFGTLREIASALKGLGIKKIDLMMVNIEGYEYALIPHMLDQRIYPKRLVMQCHEFAGDTAQLFQRIADAGYSVLWTYGAMLTAWER